MNNLVSEQTWVLSFAEDNDSIAWEFSMSILAEIWFRTLCVGPGPRTEPRWEASKIICGDFSWKFPDSVGRNFAFGIGLTPLSERENVSLASEAEISTAIFDWFCLDLTKAASTHLWWPFRGVGSWSPPMHCAADLESAGPLLKSRYILAVDWLWNWLKIKASGWTKTTVICLVADRIAVIPVQGHSIHEINRCDSTRFARTEIVYQCILRFSQIENPQVAVVSTRKEILQIYRNSTK